jgi:hypothetical protein
MLISRRTWLASNFAVLGGLWIEGGRALQAQAPADADLDRRIRRLIAEFSDQGIHRTATDVDRRSGDWLFDEVRATGATPSREPFAISRVDPGPSWLAVGDRRVDGLPHFDAAFTPQDGVRGRLGPIGSDSEIGLVEAAPNTAAAGALGDARRQRRHAAIVCVTRGGRPGLCPNNADSFLEPFGPPVLQVSSDVSDLLQEHATKRTPVHVMATAGRTTADSFNVVATVRGTSGAGRPPLVVMTPRSGWYACASERGGGIVCWLELVRTFQGAPLSRDVVFVASSGHELGHLGINAFVANRPTIVKDAVAWMHFGANIGAAALPAAAANAEPGDPARPAGSGRAGGNTVQASDDEREAVLAKVLTTAGLPIGRRVPRGTVPGGEAEAVHRGGGRYASVIGANALFHNPADRGVDAVDVAALARFTRAFADAARLLAGN